MRHRNIIAISSAALAGLALAGCGIFAPEDPEGDASAPTEPAPAVEAEEHSTGLEHATEPADDPCLAEGAVRPEDTTPGPTEGPMQEDNSAPLLAPEDFDVSHGEGRHGLEVLVTFTLQRHFNHHTGTDAIDDANVVSAISQAATIHPDYGLIVVRAFNPGSTAR